MRFCPYCGGDLAPHLAAAGRIPSMAAAPATSATDEKYDQAKVWKRLVMEADATKATPPSTVSLVNTALNRIGTRQGAFSTIVHLAFDREIVPRGGILYKAAMLEGRTETSVDQLELMGYAVKDGHVVTVNEMPVGAAYGTIQYWGGEKQHKRWHLAEPVTLNPSRNGNPFFMDANMVAFGAKWTDGTHCAEALLSLCELFISGVKGDNLVARPLALELHLQ